MTITVQKINRPSIRWDEYARRHPRATLYHLTGWKEIIEKTYGHKTYYLMAFKTGQTAIAQNSINIVSSVNALIDSAPVVGILPLVQVKHVLFGNSLISIPFFDYGGILADCPGAEQALLVKALQIARETSADVVELRNIEPLQILGLNQGPHSTKTSNAINVRKASNVIQAAHPDSHHIVKFPEKGREENLAGTINAQTRTHKVRMLLELPETSDSLMKSFKSKLRSQIRKPMKEGLTHKVGGKELLSQFYEVFASNMRDLGSPVHSKNLMQEVLNTHRDTARIVVVYAEAKPLACSIVVGFGDTLANPWASSLRQFSKIAPNMLLYWAMLEYACDSGFRYFDFGRSTVDEGTFKFKRQWGAEPIELHWHYIFTGRRSIDRRISDNQAYGKASQIWSKLPVAVTRVLGPRIRKYIGL